MRLILIYLVKLLFFIDFSVLLLYYCDHLCIKSE